MDNTKYLEELKSLLLELAEPKCLAHKNMGGKIVDWLSQTLEKVREEGRKEKGFNWRIGYEEGREDMRRELIEKIEEELEKNDKAPCKEPHSAPRGETANDYDCRDIHIGRAEALYDLLSLIKPKETK